MFVFHIDRKRVVLSYNVDSGPFAVGTVSFCSVAVFPFADPWGDERGRWESSLRVPANITVGYHVILNIGP